MHRLSFKEEVKFGDSDTDIIMVSPASSPKFHRPEGKTPRTVMELSEPRITEDILNTNTEEVFGEDTDGNKVLRAAKFDRIVKWIVFENTNDSELEAFFVSYQMVSTARNMFDTFLKIHEEFMERSGIDNNEIKKKSERFIRKLVDSGLVDTEIIPSITSFSSKNFSSSLANELKMNLLKYKHSISLSESPVSAALEASSIFRSLTKLHNIPNDKITWYPDDGILGFSSSQMAENLTLLESALLSRIERDEYFNHTKPHLSPNITLFAQHFNMVSSWVPAEIFSTEPIRQVPVLKKFINLCVKLLDLKNFNGSMEILCGLNNSSLQRYKKIWDGLPARYTEILNQVEETLSPLRNFRNYRTALALSMEANQPVVPYLAGHLKDLIFADEGNTTSNGLTSFEKLSMVGKIISQLMKAGKLPYQFQPREELLKFFTNVWWLESDDLRSCSYSFQANTFSTQSPSMDDESTLGNEETKEKFIETLYSLSSSKQRTGCYPAFAKEVHNHLFDISKLLFSKNNELQQKTRIWRGQIYMNCFSGYEAINCMITVGLCDNRRAALEIGQQLLKDNYIKPQGKITTFQDKFGAWYTWTTQEIPGFEERELRAAQKISQTQERTDRCILIAISSTTGGIQPKCFWSGMKSFSCFSGSNLVVWLSDNMKIPRGEALELCSRLFIQNLIVPVNPPDCAIEKVNDFLDSDSHFYEFGLIRPTQIQKQPETQFQGGVREDTKKRRLRKRLRSTSILEDLQISRDEVPLLKLMMDPFAGIPLLEDETIKAWSGAAIIAWLQNHMNISEVEAAKLASSFHERKIFVNPHDGARKGTHSKGASCFYLSQNAQTLCEIERGGTSVHVPDRRANPTASGSGPVLYERGKSSISTKNIKQLINDSIVIETHKSLSLLLDLCDPATGIQRSDVRFKNQSRKLFSGQKFVNWLKNHKNFSDSSAIDMFHDFASRGFIVTIHDLYPQEYSPDTMYRFLIEKGDGLDKKSKPATSYAAATTTGDDSTPSFSNDVNLSKLREVSNVSSAGGDSIRQKDILQSRMGGIENPNSPVRKGKPSKTGRKKRIDKDRRMNRPSVGFIPSGGPDEPQPVLVSRCASSDSAQLRISEYNRTLLPPYLDEPSPTSSEDCRRTVSHPVPHPDSLSTASDPIKSVKKGISFVSASPICESEEEEKVNLPNIPTDNHSTKTTVTMGEDNHLPTLVNTKNDREIKIPDAEPDADKPCDVITPENTPCIVKEASSNTNINTLSPGEKNILVEEALQNDSDKPVRKVRTPEELLQMLESSLQLDHLSLKNMENLPLSPGSSEYSEDEGESHDDDDDNEPHDDHLDDYDTDKHDEDTEEDDDSYDEIDEDYDSNIAFFESYETDSDMDITPRDTHTTPRDSLTSPRDNVFSLCDTVASPRDNATSPRDTATSPRNTLASPRYSLSSPRDTHSVTSPREYSQVGSARTEERNLVEGEGTRCSTEEEKATAFLETKILVEVKENTEEKENVSSVVGYAEQASEIVLPVEVTNEENTDADMKGRESYDSETTEGKGVANSTRTFRISRQATAPYAEGGISESTTEVIDQTCAEEIWHRMWDPQKGINVSTHKVKKKTFHKSFTGTEVCTWLNEFINQMPGMEEEDPVSVAQDLLSWGFIFSLNNKNKSSFEPGNINIYQLRTKEGLQALQAKRNSQKTKKKKRRF